MPLKLLDVTGSVINEAPIDFSHISFDESPPDFSKTTNQLSASKTVFHATFPKTA
jgi:hypothetical protein